MATITSFTDMSWFGFKSICDTVFTAPHRYIFFGSERVVLPSTLSVGIVAADIACEPLLKLLTGIVFFVLATESAQSSQQSRNHMQKVPVYSRAVAPACGWNLNLIGRVFISSLPVLLSARFR